MANNVYDVLKKIAPTLDDELKAEAEAAISQFEKVTSAIDMLDLTPNERAIFELLSDAQGACVTYDVIMNFTNIKTVGSLWVHKSRLAKKIASAGYTIGRKISKKGSGYTLDAS